MQIQLNGEGREVPDGLDVPGLLAHLGLNPARVAIERNLEILPRAQWQATAVAAGDRYEIVHFVGGGNSEIAASGAYELAELTRAVRLTIFRRRFAIWLLRIIGALTLVSFVIVALFRQTELTQTWPAAIVGVVCLLLPQLFPWWVARAQLQGIPSLRERHEFHVSFGGLNCKVGGVRSEYSWNSFVSWQEDATSFYLFRSPQQPLLIPKRFFTSGGDIENFRSLIRSQIQG